MPDPPVPPPSVPLSHLVFRPGSEKKSANSGTMAQSRSRLSRRSVPSLHDAPPLLFLVLAGPLEKLGFNLLAYFRAWDRRRHPVPVVQSVAAARQEARVTSDLEAYVVDRGIGDIKPLRMDGR